MSTVEERSLVKLNVETDVATIILNRPDVRNALNRQLMIDLIDVAQSVSDREDIRAVLLTSEGKDFSVGADLKEVSDMDPSGSLLRARRDAELGRKLLTSIKSIHQPTICAIRGIATGGGACIAAACDFRIASQSARIGLGEVKVGMNLMWNAVPLFVELLGLSRAKRLIMSGDLLGAEMLEQWGLVDEVCPDTDLATAAAQWARQYADLPPVAVQMIKRSVNQYALALSEAVMHMDEDQWILAARSDDFKECVSAFVEKRTAKPTGF
jgi:enoyl-CoA hydratase